MFADVPTELEVRVVGFVFMLSVFQSMEFHFVKRVLVNGVSTNTIRENRRSSDPRNDVRVY